MSQDTRALWEHLRIEDGEGVVLTAIYAKAGAGFHLQAASLLVGPTEIASAGWPAWRQSQHFKPRPDEELLATPAEFLLSFDMFSVGRAVLDHDEAYAFLRALLEEENCPAVGALPKARANLGASKAPIKVTTHTESPAYDLVTWLARPLDGFHFPSGGESHDLELGQSWTLDEAESFNPAVNFLGMRWFENEEPPSGFFFGRFERRAWLASQKLRPEDDLYQVEVGLEPDRIDLADLELDVEEWLGENLIFGEHLRLEDTDLREVLPVLYDPPQDKELELGVSLPTLGRGMRRVVRLVSRNGALLDEWEAFNLVESVSFTVTINGGQGQGSTVGEKRPKQNLSELLGAVERVQSQYATLRQTGAQNRIFVDPSEGRHVLRVLLERVPGELLVADPYFQDWELLEGLSKVRVLTGKGREAPPTQFKGKAKSWKKGPVPFHDRFFLWEGGGVSVGTSVGSAVKNRLFRIVRMGAAESEVLRSQFAEWWAISGFGTWEQREENAEDDQVGEKDPEADQEDQAVDDQA